MLIYFFIEVFNSATKWGDQILGLPVKYPITSVVCRSDVLFNLGLIPEEAWSYKQYYELIDKVSTRITKENTILFDHNRLDLYWSNRYWSLGGLTISRDWEVTLNNEKAYEAIKMIKKMQGHASEDFIYKSSEEIILDFIRS